MRGSMTRRERGMWAVLVMMLAASGVYAALEIGPWIITDSNGVKQVTLGTDGTVTAKALQKGASSNFLVKSLAGTNLAGIDDKGIFEQLRSGDQFGTGAGPAQGSTSSVSATFTNAEPDTSYQILLQTVGVTGTAGTGIIPFYVGDKYTDGFEVRNPAKHNSAVSFVWWKFRTATN